MLRLTLWLEEVSSRARTRRRSWLRVDRLRGIRPTLMTRKCYQHTISSPERVAYYSEDRPDHDASEGKSNLPLVETVVVLEAVTPRQH